MQKSPGAEEYRDRTGKKKYIYNHDVQLKKLNST